MPSSNGKDWYFVGIPFEFECMNAGVNLYHQHFEGPNRSEPLVILHGLLGSSRNWTSVARSLAEQNTVYCVDLRNHGKSGHTASMGYREMAEDILSWADRQWINRFHILGHSMGGKVAMRLATESPERIQSLIVADIAPRKYMGHHRVEMNAMLAMPMDTLKSRKEAEGFLDQFGVNDWALRQFILTNLVRNSATGSLNWQVNLTALDRCMEQIAGSPLDAESQYLGKALFLVGGQANFVVGDDAELIKEHFPASEMITFSDSGHNIHVDAKVPFLDAVGCFLDG